MRLQNLDLPQETTLAMATRATRARWFCVLSVIFASLDTRLDRWFAEQVVENTAEPSIIHGVSWKELDVLRGLAENLTTHAPDPALDYFVVRPWKDNAHDNDDHGVEHHEYDDDVGCDQDDDYHGNHNCDC